MAKEAILVPYHVASSLLRKHRQPDGDHPNDSRFMSWRMKAMIDLGTIFGEGSEPARHFEAISYTSGRSDDAIGDAFKRGKAQAKAVMNALLERVQLYDEAEKARVAQVKREVANARTIQMAREVRESQQPQPVSSQVRRCVVQKVMIASPSDLPEERLAATEVVNDWNAHHAEHEGVALIPIRWETHAVPQSGVRPQQPINDHLVKGADMLIAMFWTRIGSHTGKAESGTVEEIEQFVHAGKPAMLYFSKRQIDPDAIDMQQLERLRKFKSETYQNSLVASFETVGEFRGHLHRHLTEQVRRLRQSHGF